MPEIDNVLREIAWPLTILLAWFAGEFLHQRIRLPRISVYALLGFFLGPAQLGFLPEVRTETGLLLANMAIGLILFECGYRINLHWLRINPWIVVSGLAEALLTFVAVYVLFVYCGQSESTSLILASLSMASSPATIIRVINEQKSSGQVTERLIHLCALNCVLAVFLFKVIVGRVIFETSGNLWDAVCSSILVLLTSVFLGILVGAGVSAMLRAVGRSSFDSTLAFTAAVLFLIALTHSLKGSPMLAAITLGLTIRHRRHALNPGQRGFGPLGDITAVFLFVFVAAALEWRHILAGFSLGLGLIGVRQIVKIAVIAALSHVSGLSLRKGVFLGIACAPLSAFVILVLEQARFLGIGLVDQLAPLVAAVWVLEVTSPILTQCALFWAHEVDRQRGG